MSHKLPRYPIFIPSKGRSDRLLTAKMFETCGTPYRIVVEPQEEEAYRKLWGEHVILLPENNQGIVYARNWIKGKSIAEGHAKHWQFDDDIRGMERNHLGKHLACPARVAIVAAEDFTDRYSNVALTSFNSEFLVPASGFMASAYPPFYLNSRCYTVFLANNSLPNRWRRHYNDDTDMSLQVLADGWCTLLLNAFLIKTPATMTAPGGQMLATTSTYQGDGRLRMARDLERHWPGVVKTIRHFGRPQHAVKDNWRKFDTALQLKPGFVRPTEPNEYGLELKAVAEVQSASLRAFLDKELKK